MSKERFFKGTFLLTSAGLISRIMGFFYRIFLSHTIGAEGIGLYLESSLFQNNIAC